MSTLKQLQGEVAVRMRRGDTFASVDAEVIDSSGLPDAEKVTASPLWAPEHARAARLDPGAAGGGAVVADRWPSPAKTRWLDVLSRRVA
jgi:hypothetical protein